MDIGVWMSAEVLEDKLSLAREKKTRATWETSRPPRGFKPGETNRLFAASAGFWRGFFVLEDEVLYHSVDDRAPFSFVFDTRTWTPIRLIAATRFRGILGRVPPDVVAAASTRNGDRL